MTVIDPRVARILDKLAVRRERRIETFGAHAHRYALAAPLTEGEVRTLEYTHQITLPAEYRLFLLSAGASGAGPYYGLLPPAKWDLALVGDVALPDYAARPCLWTAETPRDDATWEARTGGVDEWFSGAIAIADQGCANYVTLVVTGAERGRVMYVSCDGGVPFFPENADFLSWYERWLDELTWGFEHFWFGTQMPGDEATLADAARPADGPRRLDALHAMQQLPALAPATREVVATRVRDTDPAVRVIALRLATEHGLAGELASHVRDALADDDGGVRLAALEATIAAGDWHASARVALADPSEEVVTHAISELRKASALTEHELLVLFDVPSERVRNAAIEAARTVPSSALFDRLLHIAQTQVDDPWSKHLQAVLAQIRNGGLDAPRRDAALELVLARLAAATGPEPPTAAIHGLRAFVATHPRALTSLIELTRHPEPFYRWTAAAALGELGDVGALPALRELSSDPAMPRAGSHSTAWSVGESAKRAIEKIEASIQTHA